MSAPVRLSIEGPIARLVLDRPEKRNALDEAMWRALPERLAEAEADDGVRVLVVEGAGEAFAAGADISEFEAVYSTEARAAAYSETVSAALEALAAFPRPAIAKIRGACVGGGCAIALACDLRFAARDARFGITPAKLGLVYPLADTRRLVEAVGVAAAKDLLFTGRLVDAAEAAELGLVDRLVEADALETAVAEYAAMICAASRNSTETMKALIARIQAGRGEEDAESRRIFLEAFGGADFAEGYRAFLDKRPPRFR
ncbi:enoyl-CoA hydratase [Marinicauda salina]|uniref:Enoyl-CoA hydratase n=1 Tax=Marinicauda salina TaxID=2135793 RepID=A0A2U2BXA4_9PROT|nr:enoyl-CoA hydratase-related protein [Marinicauda salina]PWE18627.1 enoyl-CoA hydratase [Marinicauda salina]